MNLDALQERKKDSLSIARSKIIQFAKDHYINMRKKDMQWNGRQIRNAVQTAVALAEYEYSAEKLKQQGHGDGSAKTHTKPCELLPEHFETVASAAEEFDNHLMDIYGAGEDERAFNRMDRAKKGEVANHFKSRVEYKYSTPRDHDRRYNYPANDSGFFEAQNSRAHRNAAGRGHGWSRSQHDDDFGEEDDYNQQEEEGDASPQFRSTGGGPGTLRVPVGRGSRGGQGNRPSRAAEPGQKRRSVSPRWSDQGDFHDQEDDDHYQWGPE